MTFNEYISKYHISLNAQQMEALQIMSGQTLLLAVPGSGKTTVVITRLKTHLCSNLKSSAYTTYKDGKLYEFTLGDKVFITDTTTGNESATLLSGMPEHFFSPTITNENFQRITVMKSINEYLNLFYSDEQNITAHNTGSGIDFELGLVDYAIDDPSVMNKLSAIIDGPGFFAVVDCFDTTMNQPYRLFSIGGSELKLKQDTL